jgi:general secretion pathway protein E
MERHEPSLAGLLDYLVSRGKVTSAAQERAKRLVEDSGEGLFNVLTRMGLVSERQLAEELADYTRFPIAAINEYPEVPISAGGLSERFIKEARLIPLFVSSAEVGIAIVNPFDSEALEAVRFATGRAVRISIAYPANFESVFERVYGTTKRTAESTEQPLADRANVVSDDVDRLKDLASEAPIIRLVNSLIAQAVEARASDIHIEPMENELRIRFRIDGLLQPITSPPQQVASAIVSRVKIMAKLNIAERRLAQDGRIKLAIRGREIDFRVATTPTIHGESVVLRVLDRHQLKLDFHALGFEEYLVRDFRKVLNQPHGILLVTGPTGSGKTTTLYTALLELNTVDRKILTVEDPVEYHLEGINQVQVKPQIGMTFANALRSFLRQDPDVMMVGEIRDLETAQIAVQAALTGHLILSTLHTNDAVSTIARLLDMGVEDYLISSTLNGIAAQRLVRTLCTSCRVAYTAVPDLLGSLAGDVGASPITLYRAMGCSACSGTGYAGRSAIVEVLPISNAIRQRILQRCQMTELHQIALESGMRSMQAHGIAKVLAGLTTVEEILRVSRGGPQ